MQYSSLSYLQNCTQSRVKKEDMIFPVNLKYTYSVFKYKKFPKSSLKGIITKDKLLLQIDLYHSATSCYCSVISWDSITWIQQIVQSMPKLEKGSIPP
jgi:hypothetical protein